MATVCTRTHQHHVVDLDGVAPKELEQVARSDVDDALVDGCPPGCTLAVDASTCSRCGRSNSYNSNISILTRYGGRLAESPPTYTIAPSCHARVASVHVTHPAIHRVRYSWTSRAHGSSCSTRGSSRTGGLGSRGLQRETREGEHGVAGASEMCVGSSVGWRKNS